MIHCCLSFFISFLIFFQKHRVLFYHTFRIFQLTKTHNYSIILVTIPIFIFKYGAYEYLRINQTDSCHF